MRDCSCIKCNLVHYLFLSFIFLTKCTLHFFSFVYLFISKAFSITNMNELCYINNLALSKAYRYDLKTAHNQGKPESLPRTIKDICISDLIECSSVLSQVTPPTLSSRWCCPPTDPVTTGSPKPPRCYANSMSDASLLCTPLFLQGLISFFILDYCKFPLQLLIKLHC